MTKAVHRYARLQRLTFDRLAIALFFLALVLAACLMPAQSDTWWQLRTGEEIWRTQSVQLRDHFSHTVSGGYWPNHEWLSQVLFYGLYRSGGLPLLTAAAALLVVGAWAIVWRLTPGSASRRLILASVAAVPASMAWSLRPQVLTLMLVATTLLLLCRRRDWFLPPLFLVWANLHGGVVLGFVLIGGAIVAETIRRRRIPIQLALVACLCALATTLTPLGTSLWTEVFESLDRLRTYAVFEWRPPAIGELVFAPFWVLAAVLTALAVFGMWQARVRAWPAVVWAALGMLPLALASGRNVPPFVLLAVPAIATLLEFSNAGLKPVADGHVRREHPVLNAAILGMAAAGVVITVAYAWTIEIARLRWHPLPDKIIAAIAACPDRLYNRYDEGGYLIWFVRERKVFLDSRQDPYPPELVLEQMRVERSGDYDALFARYGVHCAFVPRESRVAQRLIVDGWSASYQDPTWVVLAETGRGDRVTAWNHRSSSIQP